MSDIRDKLTVRELIKILIDTYDLDDTIDISIGFEKEEMIDSQMLQRNYCDGCIFCNVTPDGIECTLMNKILDQKDIANIMEHKCHNKIIEKVVEDLGYDIDDFMTLVEAWKYFVSDGGCIDCGSQRCISGPEMLLEKAFCERFKDYCSTGKKYSKDIKFKSSAVKIFVDNVPKIYTGKRHHEIAKGIRALGYASEYKKMHIDGFIIEEHGKKRFVSREEATYLAKKLGIKMISNAALTSEDLW